MDYKKVGILAAVFTVAMLILNWISSTIFGVVPRTLFGIISYPSVIPAPVQPISSTLGGKLVSYMSGILPAFDIPSIILVFISAFIAILIGMWLVSYFKINWAKSKTGKLATVILVGTVPIYLLIVGFTYPGTSSLIGVAIYTLAASYIAGWLSNIFGIRE